MMNFSARRAFQSFFMGMVVIVLLHVIFYLCKGPQKAWQFNFARKIIEVLNGGNFAQEDDSSRQSRKRKSGADPGKVKWVNFHPRFSEPLFNHADAQTSNTSTRLWFYYIITKIHPPFQNPGSAPGNFTSHFELGTTFNGE